MSELRRRQHHSHDSNLVYAHSAAAESKQSSRARLSAVIARFARATATTVVIIIALILTLVIAVGGIIVVNNGGPNGQDFQDRSTTPLLESDGVEVVAQLPSPPGNIAVASNGDIFFTFHPEFPYPVQLAVISHADFSPSLSPRDHDDTRLTRFSAYPSADAQSLFHSLLPVRIATISLNLSNERRTVELLLAIDFAHHGLFTPTIFTFFVSNATMHHAYSFPSSVVGFGSMLNDFHVNTDTANVYIADTSFVGNTPGLVIYNLRTRTSRKVLENHHSVRFQHYTPRVHGVPVVFLGVIVVRPSIDTIALSTDNTLLFYSPVAHTHLFVIDTKYVDDDTLTEEEIQKHVKIAGLKSISDGAVVSASGFVYLTDFEHSAITVMRPSSNSTSPFPYTMVTLVSSPALLRWPDGLSIGPDNKLYITNSGIHLKVRGDDMSSHAPFHICRVAMKEQQL